MTSPTDDPGVLASALLDGMFFALRRIKREAKQESSLSYADFMILGALRKSPGIGVSDLAAEAGVSGPTMSGQVKRLEAEGYILRKPGPDSDRRRISLNLSPEAEALVDSAKRRGLAWMTARLGELSPADIEILNRAAPVLQVIAGVGTLRGDDSCMAAEKFR